MPPIEAFCDGAIYPALNEAILSEDKKCTLQASLEEVKPHHLHCAWTV